MWKRRDNTPGAPSHMERRGARRSRSAAAGRWQGWRVIGESRRWSRQSGQSLVEFALVLFALLAIILGGIDGIQILMTQYTVNQAVRAAAHQGALVGGPDGSDGNVALSAQAPQNTIAQAAQLVLDSGMTTTSDRATITVSCTNPQTGASRNPCRRYDAVTVRILYLDDVWAPILMFDKVRADIKTTRAAEKDQQ